MADTPGTTEASPSARRFGAGLGAILVAALLLRVVFFVGLSGNDDLVYLEHSHAIATGVYRPVPHEFALRFGVIVPLAAVERTLGAGPVTLELPSLAASLAGILLAGLIGRRLGGPRAGWLAAALAAIVPLDVYAATDLHSDLPMAVWMMAAFWLLLRRGLLDRPAEGGAADAEPPAAAGADRRTAFLAGLAIGAGYLTKLTGFFGLLAFAALAPGRPRLRRVLPFLAAGAAAAFAVETAYFAMAAGDPLMHVRSARERHGADMESAFGTPEDVRRRLFFDLPGMLLDPRHSHFPPTGGLFMLLAAFLAVARRAPVAGRDLLGRWIVVWLLLLNFWPLRVWPYLPGHRLVPRVLAPAAIPAAILLALLAVRAITGAPRLRRAAAWGALAACAAGAVFISSVLARDGRAWRATTEQARAFLRERGGDAPVLADARTVGLLRVLDGYGDGGRYRVFTDDDLRSARGAYVVVNRFWLSRLEYQYQELPPEPVRNPPPGWREVFHWDPPPRRSLRGALLGGPAHATGGAEDRVTVYQLP